MQVKKFLALLMSAALALAVLAGCGRAVYSSQAVSAANKAQTSVDFTTSTELDNALRKAVQAGDDMTVIRNALLEELGYQNAAYFSAGGINGARTGQHAVQVYRVAGSASASAESIAKEIANVLNALRSGGEYTGCISMVSYNGSYYIAIDLTIVKAPTGSSSGGDDEPVPEPSKLSITINNASVEFIVDGAPVMFTDGNGNSYTVQISEGPNGAFTATIVTRPTGHYEATVKADGTVISPDSDGMTYTVANVTGNTNLEVTFEDPGYTVDANNKYTVWSAQGLQAWADAGVKQNADCTLTEDITLTSWNAVGSGFGTPKTYAGTFDGGGNTIFLRNCNGGGLFSNIANGGVVKNVTVDLQGTVLSNPYGATGGIANSNYGTIQNCTVKNGTIRADNLAGGGIAGRNYSTVKDCAVINCTIESSNGSTYPGGIIGVTMEKSDVTGCCVIDSEVSAPNYAGGIVGNHRYGAVTSCCFADGTVSCKNGKRSIVGLTSSTVQIFYCYWSGTLEFFDEENANYPVTEYDGIRVTDGDWSSAISEMNLNGGNFILDGGRPALNAGTTNSPAQQLLDAARLFGF